MAARTEVDSGPPSGPGRGWTYTQEVVLATLGHGGDRLQFASHCQAEQGAWLLHRRASASGADSLALGSPPALPRGDCTAPPRHSLELPSGTAAGLSPHSATPALPPRHSGPELAILTQRTMDCPWSRDAQAGLGPAGFAFWNLRERS